MTAIKTFIDKDFGLSDFTVVLIFHTFAQSTLIFSYRVNLQLYTVTIFML